MPDCNLVPSVTYNWCFREGRIACDVTYLLTYLLTHSLSPWSRVLLEKLTGSAASQEIPSTLWNPKVSSPYSQVPVISLYPEPTPSSLHPLPLPEDPS